MPFVFISLPFTQQLDKGRKICFRRLLHKGYCHLPTLHTFRMFQCLASICYLSMFSEGPCNKKFCAKQARRQKLLLLRPLEIVRCSNHQTWRDIAQRKTAATHYNARRTCCHLQARLGAAISAPLSSKLCSFSDWAQTAAAAEHPARQQS